jgi:homoserine kinase
VTGAAVAALEDVVAKRAVLVPGSRSEGGRDRTPALGCSLSGSGPSIFALAPSLTEARAVGQAMATAYDQEPGPGADLWISAVGTTAARVVDLAGGR